MRLRLWQGTQHHRCSTRVANDVWFPVNHYQLKQAAHKTLIAHRLNTVKDADQLVVLDEGRVVQEGTHDQLLGQDRLYRTCWDVCQHARSWTLQSESQ